MTTTNYTIDNVYVATTFTNNENDNKKTLSIYDGNSLQNFNELKNQTRKQISNEHNIHQKIMYDATYGDIVDKTKKVINKSDINIDDEILSFIDDCSRSNSIHTKNAYKKYIYDFCNYCNNDIQFATRNIAQKYMNSLSSKQNSSRTIRLKIAALSSFFTYLSHRHDCITNIFIKLNLPTIIDTRDLIVPNKNDIKILIEYLNKHEQYERALLIELMRDYGLRIGSFKNMRVNRDGYFITITKAKQYKNKFTSKTLKRIETIMNVKLGVQYKYIFEHIKSMSRYIVEANKLLFKHDKISCEFSCHDLRHYFSINYIEKHCKMNDVFKLQNILNHSTTSMTFNYLRSLNVEFDE